jgi:hypothetical protein
MALRRETAAGDHANLARLGPAMVAITRGPWGAWATLGSESDMLVMDQMNVEVADTVGAGDSFMAGLISGCWTPTCLATARNGTAPSAPLGRRPASPPPGRCRLGAQRQPRRVLCPGPGRGGGHARRSTGVRRRSRDRRWAGLGAADRNAFWWSTRRASSRLERRRTGPVLDVGFLKPVVQVASEIPKSSAICEIGASYFRATATTSRRNPAGKAWACEHPCCKE